MTPTVSVIMPTYNCGRFLASAIESVLAQTFGDLELIVLNDGSTDDTAEVVLPYLADPRVRYYRAARQGPSGARNVALRFARAPLIAFLDADDLWLPTKLERQLALLHQDSELGVVYTRRLLIDEQGRQLRYEQPVLQRGYVLEAMFLQNFVCFSSALLRRSVFEAVGLFDEDIPLAVDYEFWLRVAKVYRFDYVDEPLVKYRTGHANLSSLRLERHQAVGRIMRRFLNERGGRALISPPVLSQARAEFAYHMALRLRERSRLAALPWHLAALFFRPGHGLAWQALFSLLLPETVRRWLRRALGRPVDWTAPPPPALPSPLPQGRTLEPCNPHA